LNLFTEKKEIGKPGDFDRMADEELIEFVEAQGEVGHKLERQLLPPPEAARECYQALGNAAPARVVPTRQVLSCHLTIAVRPQVAKWTRGGGHRENKAARTAGQWDLFLPLSSSTDRSRCRISRRILQQHPSRVTN